MAKTFQDYGYRIVSGGTDTHLFLVDLRSKKTQNQVLTGKQAEEILSTCNIIVNRNSIPFDQQPPTITSGIRVGSPAITTRGLHETQAIKIVELIVDALNHHQEESFMQKIKKEIALICKQYPIYS
jgi:glycine hydroxymethyltransferase